MKTQPSLDTPLEPACGPSLTIYKFEDRNRDGKHDPGEAMLADVPFDIVEIDTSGAERVHQRRTDAGGAITITFDGPTQVQVRELLRQLGGQWVITSESVQVDGQWYITSQGERTWVLGCDSTAGVVWVGNARPYMPETGGGPPRAETSLTGRSDTVY